jgi:hypothetical protein
MRSHVIGTVLVWAERHEIEYLTDRVALAGGILIQDERISAAKSPMNAPSYGSMAARGT